MHFGVIFMVLVQLDFSKRVFPSFYLFIYYIKEKYGKFLTFLHSYIIS